METRGKLLNQIELLRIQNKSLLGRMEELTRQAKELSERTERLISDAEELTINSAVSASSAEHRISARRDELYFATYDDKTCGEKRLGLFKQFNYHNYDYSPNVTGLHHIVGIDNDCCSCWSTLHDPYGREIDCNFDHFKSSLEMTYPFKYAPDGSEVNSSVPDEEFSYNEVRKRMQEEGLLDEFDADYTTEEEITRVIDYVKEHWDENTKKWKKKEVLESSEEMPKIVETADEYYSPNTTGHQKSIGERKPRLFSMLNSIGRRKEY